MILTRPGNKRRQAKNIIPHFPSHNVFVSPFFGAGGMFFSKPKANYNIVNDSDSDVYNLWKVCNERPEELERQFLDFPIHADLWDYWKKNKETDDVMKAVRFLFLSNYGYLGKPRTLVFNTDGQKKFFSSSLKNVKEMLFNVQFANEDFRDFFAILGRMKDKDAFIYNDPPYLKTENNYQDGGFKEEDTKELFKLNIETGNKFAISEFKSEFICDLASDNDLEVTEIGERQNIKNRRIEILVTNYKKQLSLFC